MYCRDLLFGDNFLPLFRALLLIGIVFDTNRSSGTVAVLKIKLNTVVSSLLVGALVKSKFCFIERFYM